MTRGPNAVGARAASPSSTAVLARSSRCNTRSRVRAAATRSERVRRITPAATSAAARAAMTPIQGETADTGTNAPADQADADAGGEQVHAHHQPDGRPHTLSHRDGQ